jgi:cysteine desulfurase / selenocysteine lyase
MEATVSKNFDVKKIREDFPILKQLVHGKPLIYFDNAATTQKPQVVIDSLVNYYTTMNANIHRGIHTLADKATAAYEETRETVRAFINAKSTDEIIFTRGTTEGINLVAYSFGRSNIKAGDEIIITAMEHHSDIVPWHMLCLEKGAKLKIAPINDQGEIIIEEYQKLLSEKTKLVSLVYVSNTLGTVNPVREMIRMARKTGAKVLIDGAQAAAHFRMDVQELDCDFFVMSSHKLYGPTGMGVLYGKREILEAIPPFHGGGEMIKEVTYEKTTYNELPYKFEAGTPNIADTIAFKPALEYINKLGKENTSVYEHSLLEYGTVVLSGIPKLKIIGEAKEKVSIISFVIPGINAMDLGMLLDNEGIAIRTGHHCTQPLMGRFAIDGTSRASFAFYNTKEEIDQLVKGIHKAVRLLS